MVHTAKKKIRKHRGIDESPLNNDVLNTILLVTNSVFICLYAQQSFIVYSVLSMWQALVWEYKMSKMKSPHSEQQLQQHMACDKYNRGTVRTQQGVHLFLGSGNQGRLHNEGHLSYILKRRRLQKQRNSRDLRAC